MAPKMCVACFAAIATQLGILGRAAILPVIPKHQVNGALVCCMFALGHKKNYVWYVSEDYKTSKIKGMKKKKKVL